MVALVTLAVLLCSAVQCGVVWCVVVSALTIVWEGVVNLSNGSILAG